VTHRTDIEQLQTRWYQLTPHEQANTATRCGWSTASVASVLNSRRIFAATPAGDLRALALALGLSGLDHSAAADAALAAARKTLQHFERRGPDPEAAAQEVLHLLARRSLPIDLDHLARKMGTQIRERPSLVEGRLLTGPDETVVVVSSNRGWARKRFTIAHELGHLWLLQRRQPAGAPSLAWRAEERFCDEFAAALLMPRGWLTRRAQELNRNLRSLELLALEARTSVSATLIRLRTVDPRWNMSLLKFRPEASGAWRLVAVIGPSRGMVARLRCIEETGALLRSAVGERRPIKGTLCLTLDGKPIEVPAEAAGNSQRTLLVLARLPKVHAIAASPAPKQL
jgi:IrrE N-terminal-like domain